MSGEYMMKKTLIVMLIAIISFGSVLTGCEEDSSSVISMTESISSKSASSKIDDSSKADSESKNDGKTSGLYKAPENSPVALHGKLSVQGSDLVDEHGEKFQLRGLSTHGLTWYPQFVNEGIYATLKDDWKANCIRLAMYVDESTTGGSDVTYLNNKQGSLNILSEGIKACLDLGLYVIIDWHVLNPGDPTAYTDEARAFFGVMSSLYAGYPNIIYEICNEPNGDEITWNSHIKPYCDEIVSVIRGNDSEAVIIAGTATWSQDIHDVSHNLLDEKNIMYALHFYAGTHKASLRNRLINTYNSGIPVFVSEFGVCDATGNGINDFDQTMQWLNLLDELNISYINWNISDKDESSSIFLNNSGVTGYGFTEANLTDSGRFIRNWYIDRALQLG